MAVSPLDYAHDLLRRADALANMAGHQGGTGWNVDSDLLRCSWAFIGASIDTYFHNRVRRTLTSSPMTSSAQKYPVPVGEVEALIKTFLANRATSRPRPTLNRIVHESLLTDTFQGSRNVERAFNLIGISKPWSQIGRALHEQPRSVRARLDRQYHRRNTVVHEGDYPRQLRPRSLQYNAISRPEVNDEIVWTRSFVDAVDTL